MLGAGSGLFNLTQEKECRRHGHVGGCRRAVVDYRIVGESEVSNGDDVERTGLTGGAGAAVDRPYGRLDRSVQIRGPGYLSREV